MLRLQKIISALVQYRLFWRLVEPIAKLGSFMKASRDQMEARLTAQKANQQLDKLFGPIFAERKVLHGPFKGVVYPELNSIGSTLYPKLIGSYEAELHEIIEQICNTSYSEVLNIGCGEGYYAIGLGLRISNVKIHAYDTDDDARRLCKQMAEINNIGNRVEIGSFCSKENLKNFKFTKKGLIVCDCEGFELELFDQASVLNLKDCDLLIETHDFVDISISTKLLTLFSQTHNVTVIKSKDDIEKAKTYQYHETSEMTLETKKQLFAEKRPAIMEWLFISPKNSK